MEELQSQNNKIMSKEFQYLSMSPAIDSSAGHLHDTVMQLSMVSRYDVPPNELSQGETKIQ